MPGDASIVPCELRGRSCGGRRDDRRVRDDHRRRVEPQRSARQGQGREMPEGAMMQAVEIPLEIARPIVDGFDGTDGWGLDDDRADGRIAAFATLFHKDRTSYDKALKRLPPPVAQVVQENVETVLANSLVPVDFSDLDTNPPPSRCW